MDKCNIFLGLNSIVRMKRWNLHNQQIPSQKKKKEEQ